MDIEYINTIIRKSVTQVLSSDEEKKLAHWIVVDKENEDYYAKVKAVYTLEELQTEKMRDEKLVRKLVATIRHHRNKNYLVKYTAAAVIFLMVMVGGFIYYNGVEDGEVMESKVVEVIESGLVVKRNNQRIDPVAGRMEDLACVIDETEKEVVLKGVDTLKNEEVTIFVARGYQYRVTLPDSTKVWLNSESELRYVNFGRERREVTLKGEACFDVVKDKLRPFVVNLNNKRSVTVLGTFFSVKAYDGDNDTKVSLVEGSVNVKTGKENLLLTPNKEVVIDNQSNEAIVQEFDSRKIRTWITGGVVYYNEALEEIAKDMSRRYNREFSFEDENVKRERLTVVLDSTMFDDIINYIKRAGKGVFTVEQKDGRIVFKDE